MLRLDGRTVCANCHGGSLSTTPEYISATVTGSAAAGFTATISGMKMGTGVGAVTLGNPWGDMIGLRSAAATNSWLYVATKTDTLSSTGWNPRAAGGVLATGVTPVTMGVGSVVTTWTPTKVVLTVPAGAIAAGTYKFDIRLTGQAAQRTTVNVIVP